MDDGLEIPRVDGVGDLILEEVEKKATIALRENSAANPGTSFYECRRLAFWVLRLSQEVRILRGEDC